MPSDQFGEQTYIKHGEEAGGLKDISTNPEQVAEWVTSFVICSHVSTSTVYDMYPEKIAKQKTQGIKKKVKSVVGLISIDRQKC